MVNSTSTIRTTINLPVYVRFNDTEYEVGTIDVPVTLNVGYVAEDVQKAIEDAAEKGDLTPSEIDPELGEGVKMGVDFCPDHQPVQHRDGKEPWCNLCRLNINMGEPSGGLPRKDPPLRYPRPRVVEEDEAVTAHGGGLERTLGPGMGVAPEPTRPLDEDDKPGGGLFGSARRISERGIRQQPMIGEPTGEDD